MSASASLVLNQSCKAEPRGQASCPGALPSAVAALLGPRCQVLAPQQPKPARSQLRAAVPRRWPSLSLPLGSAPALLFHFAHFWGWGTAPWLLCVP